MRVTLPEADRRYSREEYRRWCDARSRGRYERVDGRIVARAPDRVGHVRVKGAVFRALDRAVREAGVPCEALPDGVTVEVDDGGAKPDRASDAANGDPSPAGG